MLVYRSVSEVFLHWPNGPPIPSVDVGILCISVRCAVLSFWKFLDTAQGHAAQQHDLLVFFLGGQDRYHLPQWDRSWAIYLSICLSVGPSVHPSMGISYILETIFSLSLSLSLSLNCHLRISPAISHWVHLSMHKIRYVAVIGVESPWLRAESLRTQKRMASRCETEWSRSSYTNTRAYAYVYACAEGLKVLCTSLHWGYCVFFRGWKVTPHILLTQTTSTNIDPQRHFHLQPASVRLAYWLLFRASSAK